MIGIRSVIFFPVITVFLISLQASLCMADDLSGDRITEAEEPAGQIQVSNGWIRMVPPVSTVSAVYMSLTNQSEEEDALIGVTSERAERAELHHMEMSGGMMRMMRVDQFILPVNKTVPLQAGGNHIMLVGLKEPLKEGEQVALTLEFARSSAVTLSLEVQAEEDGGPGTKSMDDHSSHHH